MKNTSSDNSTEYSNNTTQKKKNILKNDISDDYPSSQEYNSSEQSKEIKSIINQLSSYNTNISQRQNKNSIIFECPKEKCPYIPSLKYYEYTQTISSVCRMNHKYNISLCDYFKKILNNLTAFNYCQECMKKHLDKNQVTPEYYCLDCSFFLCKNCQMKHFKTHKVYELIKINTCCHIHERTKFSGFCRSCKKDLCIHCLKDHDKGKGHHSLVKYLVLLPSKEKINKYKKQIKDEIDYIEKLKNILFEENENAVKDQNIRNILEEFFDRMKLKYYFYDIQLQTFDKIKFNMNIIKNVTDLFLIKQQTFEGIYNLIQGNFSQNKLEIINKILSIVLKYKLTTNKIDKNKEALITQEYSTHFKFNHVCSMNKKKNIRFLYLLKSGKFILCSETDGLYVYDDGTYKELIHIPSEIEIIDLCENDTGLLFLLKKSMIEIIRLEENSSGYYTENKILFKTIDQVNFITCLDNGTIIVSRTKRTEGNLDIWMKSQIKKDGNNNDDNGNNSGNNNNNNNNWNNGNNNNGNNRDGRDYTIRRVYFAPDRRRNMINIVNNNLRLGVMLRNARHNVGNFMNNNIGNNLINNLIINPNNMNNINNINNNNAAENNNNNPNNNNNNDANNNNQNNNENNEENEEDEEEENENENEENNDNNDDNDNNNNDNGNNDNNNDNNNNNNGNNDENNNNENNNSNNNNINLGNIPNINLNTEKNNTINNNNTNGGNNNNNNNNNSNPQTNENILLQEIPDNLPNLNENNLNNNNNPNLSNNIILPNLNQINLNNNIQNNINNITRPGRYPRIQAPRPRPRFVHVIRFIRDQLQGLVHNLEQEELVLEDPSLVSSVGIYGSKDSEITHINKAIKKFSEIIALLDWNKDYFICAEFHIERREFKGLRIYSKENYEPIKKKYKFKVKYCLRDKNCLIKINEDLIGVCYVKDEIEYGVSIVSFKTKDEVTRYELPRFNCVKNILLNNNNYLFVFCKEIFNKNDDVIKVLKIQNKELIQSSNYFFEEFLNTYVYNNSKNILKDEIKDKNIELNNEINLNNYEQEQDSFDEKEMNTIVSMIKLNNDTFVCLNKDNTINFYKVE